MPSGSRDIIVGGGIDPIAPFTIGAIPVIVNDDPASASDSILSQQSATSIRLDGNDLDIGQSANAFERVKIRDANRRWSISMASESPLLGQDAICIGMVTAMSATGVRACAIGSGSASGQDALCIMGGSSALQSTVVGTAASCAATSGTAIGKSASSGTEAAALGNEANAAGLRSISIGSGSDATHSLSGAIGVGAQSIKDNFIVIGTTSVGHGVRITNTLEVGLQIKLVEGANRGLGVATLVAGTVTVNNTLVTATSRILLTPQNAGGGSVGAVFVSARVAGTSFTITSSDAADDRDVAWLLLDAA